MNRICLPRDKSSAIFLVRRFLEYLLTGFLLESMRNFSTAKGNAPGKTTRQIYFCHPLQTKPKAAPRVSFDLGPVDLEEDILIDAGRSRRDAPLSPARRSRRDKPLSPAGRSRRDTPLSPAGRSPPSPRTRRNASKEEVSSTTTTTAGQLIMIASQSWTSSQGTLGPAGQPSPTALTLFGALPLPTGMRLRCLQEAMEQVALSQTEHQQASQTQQERD